MVRIFDLDETLISTSLRQFNVIQSFVQLYFPNEKKRINYHNYLEIRKTQRISNGDFYLKYISNEFFEEFKIYFISEIEKIENLYYDSLILNIDLFKEFRKNYSKDIFVLLSLRSNEQNSLKQLEYLNLNWYFDEVYFLKHSTQNPKTLFLRDYIKSNQKYHFIGDSDTDYEAANSNGIIFDFVNTSIYSDKKKLIKNMDINQLLLSNLCYE